MPDVKGDQYDIQEVEKEVMEEVTGKKPRKRSYRQMEYCYEPELEGVALWQLSTLSLPRHHVTISWSCILAALQDLLACCVHNLLQLASH